jgi:hypothetical protein
MSGGRAPRRGSRNRGDARIRGLVLEGHKDAAVEVPFDPAERFGIEAAALRRGRRGHRVHVRAGDRKFESEVVPRSKRFWLVLPASVLAELNLMPGDAIELSIEPRIEPVRGATSARAISSKRRARRSSSGAARRGG